VNAQRVLCRLRFGLLFLLTLFALSLLLGFGYSTCRLRQAEQGWASSFESMEVFAARLPKAATSSGAWRQELTQPLGIDIVGQTARNDRFDVKSVQGAWTSARKAANLGDLQLCDLRDEAASRFDEAGVPIVYLSSLLGHSNLSATSRYLNIHRRGLHLAMQKLEESRAVAQTLHKTAERPLAVVQDPPALVFPKATVQ
jgi:integrase-like protein